LFCFKFVFEHAQLWEEDGGPNGVMMLLNCNMQRLKELSCCYRPPVQSWYPSEQLRCCLGGLPAVKSLSETSRKACGSSCAIRQATAINAYLYGHNWIHGCRFACEFGGPTNRPLEQNSWRVLEKVLTGIKWLRNVIVEQFGWQ